MRNTVRIAAASLAFSLLAPAQTPYTPQFKGDPAHSIAEAAALGYMRTVLYAQHVYYKKHGSYATSLRSLVGSSSFTRRMTNPDRGDYTVHFTSTGKNFSLSMVPKQFDPAHRAFFADDTGTIRAEDDQPATASSPSIKAKPD
ncbi:MAG: hypothetical protein LAN64_08700 [Acidobacteriia bacterium]|nr:hypothetical protein [Terriglobia bacterium]